MTGLYCGAAEASLVRRLIRCNPPPCGAKRINIPAPAAENDDRNPPRTKSRSLFSLGVGTDNLFHSERIRTVVRFTVLNLSNKAALYNFLSPFSGTHWIDPRTFQAHGGWSV